MILTPHESAAIRTLLRKGWACGEIARHFHLSVDRIEEIVRDGRS